MKRFITLLLLMTVALISYSQDSTKVINNNDSIIGTCIIDTIYPQLLKVDGKVIGVLFTIEQAQKIDNDYEMYSLMDSIVKEYGLNDSITVGIIDAQGKKITSLELQVDNMKTMLKNKDAMLDNRDTTITEFKRKIDLYNAEIVLRNEREYSYKEEVNALKKEVKKQKRQKVIGFITTGLGVAGVIILGSLVK